MSNDAKFLPFETALQLVGAIQEEEHIHEPERRIFTVYDKSNRELCWFDAAETIAAAAPDYKTQKKEKVQPLVETYILNHIPDWVLE
ncbi:MAG: hypothetical protein A2521_13355 [Deltaproteobacteria bacterium RIFOXYD12_FULL_57_12]|nr:MAG: hypothetical protein A2521_13355 [Deltaproteobacteria bacterium RIFOXYD12_FULL_57_12]